MPVYSGTIKQHNFCVLPITGASGNTGKGWYKVVITSGGTTTPTPYTHYIRGMTSTATALIMNTTSTGGTWAGGDWAGSIHIFQAIGTFTDGEALGLYLVSDDSQVSADVATYTAGSYAVDALDKIDSVTGAKGLATTAPICGLAKSPAPTSLGVTANVTKASRNVTLSSAVNLTITDCENTTGWTGYNGASVGQNTTASKRKQGSASLNITMPASPATNTKYAVFVISSGSDTDLSAWQQLNFWVSPNNNTDHYRLTPKLCSDEAGDTPVNTFTMRLLQGANNAIVPHVCDYGSALSATVRSIAFYSDSSVAPAANAVITIDNIFLSKAPSADDSLTLKSLISFSSADNVQDNAWYPIKSISGTALVIDNHPNADYNTGRGFSEDTVSSQTLYKRECFTVFTNTSSSTAVQTTQVAGTNGTYISYEGGINIQTGVQEGYTFFCGDNGWGFGLNVAQAMNLINRIGMIRYYRPFIPGSVTLTKYQDISGIGNAQGIYYNSSQIMILDGYLNSINNGTLGFYVETETRATNNSTINTKGNLTIGLDHYSADNSFLKTVYAYNNGSYGLAKNIGKLKIKTYTSRDNATASIYFPSSYIRQNGEVKIENATIAESTEVSFATTSPYYGIAYLGNLGGTANNHQPVMPAGRGYMQSSEKPSDVSFAWKLSPTSNIYRSWTPLQLRISPEGGFWCEASKQVTIKARIKVSNANITGGILVPALQAGLTADQIVTSTSTTASWGEEVTLQFTPPSAGAIEVFFIAYYPDNSSTHTYSAYIAAPVAVEGVYTMFTQAT